MNLAQTVVDKLIEAEDELRRLSRVAVPGLGVSERIRKQLEANFGKAEVLYYGAGTEAERKRWGGHLVRRITVKIALLDRVMHKVRREGGLVHWPDLGHLVARLRYRMHHDIKNLFERIGLYPTFFHVNEFIEPLDIMSDSGWTITLDIMFTDAWWA